MVQGMASLLNVCHPPHFIFFECTGRYLCQTLLRRKRFDGKRLDSIAILDAGADTHVACGMYSFDTLTREKSPMT